MGNKREVKVKITEQENAVLQLNFARGKKTEEQSLHFFKNVSVDSKGPKNVYKLNVIQVSARTYHELPKQGDFVLVNPENGRFDLVEVQAEASIQDETEEVSVIRAVPAVKERLDYKKGQSNLYLCTLSTSELFSTFRRQSLEHVKADNLIVSAECYDSMILNSPFQLFDVVNKETGESICLQKKHIIRAEKAEGKPFLKMNRKHRIFLGLEKKSKGERNGEPQIYIRPVPESFMARKGFHPWKMITRFFVGKSALSLVCKRPYECDENTDVIRLSNSNMKLLGVEEIDSVILKHHMRTVKCRVLELDDKDVYLEMNGGVATETQEAEEVISADLAVCIPAHIRKKLGLHYIDSAVKVERDTNFLFSKSLPDQIVPLLLTFTASGLVLDTNIIIELIFAIWVVYLNFSSKRHMRSC